MLRLFRAGFTLLLLAFGFGVDLWALEAHPDMATGAAICLVAVTLGFAGAIIGGVWGVFD